MFCVQILNRYVYEKLTECKTYNIKTERKQTSASTKGHNWIAELEWSPFCSRRNQLQYSISQQGAQLGERNSSLRNYLFEIALSSSALTNQSSLSFSLPIASIFINVPVKIVLTPFIMGTPALYASHGFFFSFCFL